MEAKNLLYAYSESIFCACRTSLQVVKNHANTKKKRIFTLYILPPDSGKTLFHYLCAAIANN